MKKRIQRKATAKMSISLPHDVSEWLEQRCEDKHDSRSSIILDALQAYMTGAGADADHRGPTAEHSSAHAASPSARHRARRDGNRKEG